MVTPQLVDRRPDKLRHLGDPVMAGGAANTVEGLRVQQHF
jgi:hypothetical protein